MLLFENFMALGTFETLQYKISIVSELGFWVSWMLPHCSTQYWLDVPDDRSTLEKECHAYVIGYTQE